MKNKDRWTNPTDRIRRNKEKDIRREMIEKAEKAFCNFSECGVQRDTCLSLGTCDAYDRFKKMLEE